MESSTSVSSRIVYYHQRLGQNSSELTSFACLKELSHDILSCFSHGKITFKLKETWK